LVLSVSSYSLKNFDVIFGCLRCKKKEKKKRGESNKNKEGKKRKET
jgi:hypothetical protein